MCKCFPADYLLKVPTVFDEGLSYEEQVITLQKEICFLAEKVKALEEQLNNQTT